ncbi:hypothetical protein BDF14DRAFT_1731888 [Spinellus fusiger]|nr:hypothetical protein BDF14DRAFT_1731888 [Spinellus fusiger]
MLSEVQSSITETIESYSDALRQLSLKIHGHPELSSQEVEACALLTDFLEQQGFHVTRRVAGLETGFLAEYGNSETGRRVGFCSEYDALPDVGHGCGHNLIAIAGVACALATKAALEKNLIQGKVVLFGTPAEETLNGKAVYLKNEIFQSRVDVCMMLHPFSRDGMYLGYFALDKLTVEFFGRASHAGMAPWDGINAVDAIMQGWDNLSMLRQQMLPTNRIHGIITEGGKSANVIPDYASASFMARSVTRKELDSLKERLENCFKAAALATGCDYKLTWSPLGATDDAFQNQILAESYKKHMIENGIVYPPPSEERLSYVGSTDMGNVSYTIPSIHPIFSIHTEATNHTREFAKAAATEQAHKACLLASRGLSFVAAEVLLDSALYEAAVAEFRRGNKH